jgi:manganese/zinc/iron transport system ATP- binding protein
MNMFNNFFHSKKVTTLNDRPEHNPQSPLSVHAMTVAYNERPVLWDIDFDTPEQSLIAIVGPNGAGKSTFIKACLGLVPMASGLVEYWGKSLEAERNNVAYVPQRESVDWSFPVSALDVVTMGLYRQIGWFKPVRNKHLEQAKEYLSQVGLAEYAYRQISQLSGGQQQRVFLARALAQQAKLYFMDEPFAGVDAATEYSIIQVLKGLRDNGCTVICVHHDLVSVPEYFDHVLLINNRKVASGEIAEAFTNENLRKTYGGRLTLLDEVSNTIAQVKRGYPQSRDS